jgi:uncharacterized protein YecE (DUF72 family)
MTSTRILVGVAGWSYPDWRGTFYPLRRDPRGDLPLVARTFDCVEINVTFYRLPAPRMAATWLKAVEGRPDFLFTTKVPKELTHEKSLEPDALEAGVTGLKESLRPLIEAGRIGTVLIQFPFYFADSPESRDRIRRLVDALLPLPVSVEVRHLSFFREKGRSGPAEKAGPGGPHPARAPAGALTFLEEIGAGIVNIDIPEGRATVPPSSLSTSPTGYVRLHGRNSRAWFDPRAGRDEKYNYLYSAAELTAWKDRILALGERTLRTFVIANNHFKAQAPANAVELLHLLGRTPSEVPRELLETYPELAASLGRTAPVQGEIPGLEADPRAAPEGSRGREGGGRPRPGGGR